jgi:hypothetical protein
MMSRRWIGSMKILGIHVMTAEAAGQVRDCLRNLLEENARLKEQVEFHERQNAVRQRVADKLAAQRDMVDAAFLRTIGIRSDSGEGS